MKNAVFILSLILLSACKQQQSYEQNEPDGTAQIYERGELRAITIESAISYYTSGDEQMGFDYDLAQNFADYMDLPLKIIVANSIEEVKQLLLNGEGDFAAYQMPRTKQNQMLFNITNVTSLANIALVQPKDRQQITDVTELAGKEIFVNDSKYLQRLQHLNEEIGGGVVIRQLPDSLTVEQIMYEVSAHNLPLTIADNDIAELGKFYFKNIDCSVAVGLPRQKSWLVRKNAPQLADSINVWFAKVENSRFFKKMKSRYLEKNSYYENFEIAVPQGSVSPYDSIFKADAHIVGWDWRLLAAVARRESHFNPDAVSGAGAMGIMQLMPRTGAKYGLNDSTFFEPEDNIRAGIEYLAVLQKMFNFIENADERVKFVLAAYNAGQGHIFDAVALAKKYGANPHVWNQNVEKYLLLKSESEYYNDGACKLGYFRANHTVRYVNDVLRTYDRYLGVKTKN